MFHTEIRLNGGFAFLIQSEWTYFKGKKQRTGKYIFDIHCIIMCLPHMHPCRYFTGIHQMTYVAILLD